MGFPYGFLYGIDPATPPGYHLGSSQAHSDMSSKTLISLLICLLIAAAGIGALRFLPRSGAADGVPPPRSAVVVPDGAAGAVKPVPKVDAETLLKDLARRWEEVRTTTVGADRESRQQALCAEAVAGLGAGEELVRFLNFLSTSGAAAQREWVLGPGLRELFAGSQAPTAREQMLTVTDDALRNTFCLRAGEAYGALGFKEYLDSLAATPHAACQSPLLAGRCVALAQTSLEAAVYAFRELKSGAITHACLGEALAVAFATTDYAGVKAALNALPEDLKREAVNGLCGKQGKNVGPYLAALDEILHTADWPKNEKGCCVKLHNLVLYSPEIEVLLAWAVLLPERTDTEDLFRVATRPFVTRYPDKAKPWILALPAGWKRQNALAGFTQAALMARSDIPGAQWARGLITDPGFAASADGWILQFEQKTGKPFPR